MAFAIVAFCCVFLFFASAGLLLFYRESALKRIASVVAKKAERRSLSRTLHKTTSSLGVAVERLERVIPKTQAEVSVVQQRLIRAGYRKESALKFFYGTKVLAPVALCAVAFV